MAEFKETLRPTRRPAQKLAELGRQPLPADQAAGRSTCREYYAPKNFNFWYFFGSLALLVLVIQIVTGIFLTMHYKPDAAHGLRVGRVHHARRAVGLADPLHALHRRLGVLHRRLPAHVPRPDLRQLPQAARAGLDLRLRDLPVPDGRGLHRLPAAVGPDVATGARR